MSLEEALRENTAAVLKLCAAMGGKDVGAAPATTVARVAETPKEAASTQTAAPITYENVKVAVLSLIKAYDKGKALEVFEKHQPGTTKADQISESKWPALIKECEALIAAKKGAA